MRDLLTTLSRTFCANCVEVLTQFYSARECSTQRQTQASARKQYYLAAGAGVAGATGTAGAVAPGTTPGIADAGAAGTLGTLDAPGTELAGTAPVAAGALFGKPGTADPTGGATGAVCEKFCMMPVS